MKTKIKEIIDKCLKTLLSKDRDLIDNDVSERAITHKFAEYLQSYFPDLNVDCEYNRNFTRGKGQPKSLWIVDENVKKALEKSLDSDDRLSVSTFPDVIVHRRLKNDHNILVIEFKKVGSKVDKSHDEAKLRAFTETTGQNSYRYKYGVLIIIDTTSPKKKKPELIWFVNGDQIT
jgi:hypothetical protein